MAKRKKQPSPDKKIDELEQRILVLELTLDAYKVQLDDLSLRISVNGMWQ